MVVTDFEQRIIDDVAKFGWHSLSVAPRENSDDPQEWWTYTVGLAVSRRWPELVIIGQPPGSAHGILDAAITECEARDMAPHPGLLLQDTLEGYGAILVDGSKIPSDYVNSANWFARHNGIAEPERLQLLWPDREGNFPFDPNCDPGVRSLQEPIEPS